MTASSTRSSRALVVASVAVLAAVAVVVGAVVWRRLGVSTPEGLTIPSDAPSTGRSAEEEASQAALVAYNGFREASVAATAPGAAPHPDHPKYAVDPALAQVRFDVYQMNRAGLVTTGRPVWNARVVSVNLAATPKTIKLSDCLDITNWQTITKSTGQPAGAPNQAQRYVIAAEAILADDARRMVREPKAQREKSC